MAFGFTPKHEVELSLNGFDRQRYLAICLIAADNLKWKVNYISNNGFIAYTSQSIFSWNAEVKLTVKGNVVTISSESTGSEFFDWGKNKRKLEEFIEAYDTVQASATDEQIDAKLSETKDNVVSDEEDVLTAPPETTGEKFRGFFSLFIPHQGYFITPIIIDLNILIFILMAISGVNILLPENEGLLAWGANFRPLTLSGEWWRIVSSTFIHIGVIHLLLNMYALLYIGTLLERHLGRLKFFSAYMLTGVAASVTSLCWHDLTISAGASGAIFGLYGVFLAMLTTNFIEKTVRRQMLASIGVFVAYNLLYGMKEGIDNAAHIGGLLSGLVVGYAYYPSLIKPADLRIKYATLSILLILTISISFVTYGMIPNDTGEYQVKMRDFTKNEDIALGILNSAQGKSDIDIAHGLKEMGIENWNKNLALLKELKKLDLPEALKEQNVLLIHYCELRIQSYSLMIRSLNEKTLDYDTKIDSCNTAINQIIEDIRSRNSNE